MGVVPIDGWTIGTAHIIGVDTATPVIVQVHGPDGWLRLTVRERRSDPATVQTVPLGHHRPRQPRARRPTGSPWPR